LSEGSEEVGDINVDTYQREPVHSNIKQRNYKTINQSQSE